MFHVKQSRREWGKIPPLPTLLPAFEMRL
jgi:hypothetical protein